jgi:hypothetical protein
MSNTNPNPILGEVIPEDKFIRRDGNRFFLDEKESKENISIERLKEELQKLRSCVPN